MEPAAFAAVMDADVTQSWLLARAAAVQMKAQGSGLRVSSARGFWSIRRAIRPIAHRRRRSRG